MVADELGGGLDRQSRLAGPAGTGQRDEPSAFLAEQRDDLGDLALAADERARRPRQVRVRDRLQRRESLRAELEDPDRVLEVLQAVLAEVDECVVVESGRSSRRVREQDLPAVTRRADPGAEVHDLADVALVRQVRRSGVDPTRTWIGPARRASRASSVAATASRASANA